MSENTNEKIYTDDEVRQIAKVYEIFIEHLGLADKELEEKEYIYCDIDSIINTYLPYLTEYDIETIRTASVNTRRVLKHCIEKKYGIRELND